MTNNIKKLRVAFLLTPSELAELLNIDTDQLNRLEAAIGDLPEEWAEAVGRALGIPAAMVTDPKVDIYAAVASARAQFPHRAIICRIGARFAIQSIVAKFGGLKMALDLDEDDLAAAIQNLVSFTNDNDSGNDNDSTPEQQLNRLSQSLQITALTILQSRGVDPSPDFPQTMAIARDGALSLMQSFSRIEQMRRDQEKQ